MFGMIVFAFTVKGKVETNLLRTILPNSIMNSTNIVPLADKSSSIIKVVFESESIAGLEKLKNTFVSSLDKTDFEAVEPEVSKLIGQYLSNPANFLSYNSRKLLGEKKYDELYAKSLESLYNPAGIQLTSIDKDPYLLLDDYLLSNKRISEGSSYIDSKYYDYLNVKIKNKDGLSPDLSNKKIFKIVKLQKKLTCKNSRVYLAGTPIHSFYTSINSIVSINFICLLSTFLIIFLTYYYFKNLKMLIPVGLSIIFGMLTGYIAARLWFDNFQIVTMVFSTTLIGIGIDYSYHYCFADKKDKRFIKNLSMSLVTTLIPFVLLYLTNIEILRQISVFTVFGLCAIYLFILIFYPCFGFSKPCKSISFSPELYRKVFILLIILGMFGVCRINFNNSLTALYMPSKNLVKAESLYNKISGNYAKNSQFITVQGNTFEDMLEKEEKITDSLNQKHIEYLSLSKFIPSVIRQQENFQLVKNLYKEKPENYSDILSVPQRLKLRNRTFEPVVFNLQNYPYLSDFILSDNTSVILAYTDKSLGIYEQYAQTVNIKQDIERYMKNYSQILMKIFPVVILLLTILFIFIYGIKKGIKVLIPPLSGTVLSVGLTGLTGLGLNLFSIIALFMVLGFTIDYSVFRASGEKQTEDAIFVSGLTTCFSFLMLSLSGFKLLASISIVLFWGILVSYITGYLVFSGKQNNSMVQLSYEKD